MSVTQDDSENIEEQSKGRVDIIIEVIKGLPMAKLTAGMVFVIVCMVIIGYFAPKLYATNVWICIIFMIMIFIYGLLFIYIEYKKTEPINDNEKFKS